jgi:phage virion morphogenesis protein
MADLITAKIDDREILKALDKLKARARNLRPVMGEIAADMLDAVQENFAKEGRPGRWKPSKRAKKEGGQTLQQSRRLLNSITADSDNQAARVGTNVEYAAIHHFGGTVIRFKAANANTGASTIAIDALAAVAIKRPDGSTLQAGDILSGQLVTVVYDGTYYQMVSGNLGFGNVAEDQGLNVWGAPLFNWMYDTDKFGDEDEVVSSVLGKLIPEGKAVRFRTAVDWFFLKLTGEVNHCLNNIEADEGSIAVM